MINAAPLSVAQIYCSFFRDAGTLFSKIVANLLPKEIDSTLKVDVDLFQSCRNFHEAWLVAQQVFGAEIDDETPLIEAETENGG